MKPSYLSVVCSFCLLAGCLPSSATTPLVPADPFGMAPTNTSRLTQTVSPASLEAAARVDRVGRRILAANPRLGARPMFRTIGAPEAEIFHVGASEIHVTEGLAKQCTTDGELAAALCLELGKIVAEREGLAAAEPRMAEPLPPQEVRVGNDNSGSFGPADQLHRAELAKVDQDRRRRKSARATGTSRALAQTYLTQAGYAAIELDAVDPVLRSAAENRALANQVLTGTPAQITAP